MTGCAKIFDEAGRHLALGPCACEYGNGTDASVRLIRPWQARPRVKVLLWAARTKHPCAGIEAGWPLLLRTARSPTAE